MADKTIGELPSIANVTSTSLIPVEQSGVAGKMTGQQFQDWAVAGAQPYATQASNSAEAAANSATAAASSATNAAGSATSASNSSIAAENARQKIEDMGVESTTLDPGSQATVSKSVSQGVVTLTFGIPQGATGAQGATGPQGPQGVQGPAGATGTAAVVETQGMYVFNVDNNSASATYGHLLLTYTGEEEPTFEIDYDTTSDTYGHLLWVVSEE